MKTILLFGVLALCAGAANATNYYFASNGDDNRTATQASSPATPWRSINKFNAIAKTLRPGDTVFFKRGDIFTGNLKPVTSGTATAPIVLTAYGSGSKPVLSGFKNLTNWVSAGKGIYELTDSGLPSRINMVTLNGNPTGMGRWPNADATNKGYMTIESATSTSISDHQLTSATNWTGAELVLRSSHWTLDRVPIKAHSGTTITFGQGATYAPKVKYGYFIQNDVRTFDRVGEWAYNSKTKKFSMYFGANSPAAYTVKVSAAHDVLTLFDDNYYTIKDLAIEGANENGVDLYSCDHIRLLDCEVQTNGMSGLYAAQSKNLTIENNDFRHNANMAIQTPLGIRNLTVRNNTVSNTGMIAGMGKNGSGNYTAMIVYASNSVVEHNRVTNSGYAGIRFDGDHITIRQNLVQHFAMVLGDVGGIYTWGDGGHVGRKVLNNIVLDGYGAKEGTQYNTSLHASGIYLDDNAKNIEIRGNTVARCGRNGIYLHNTQNITIRDNTFYDNANTQFLVTHDNTLNYPIRGINVKNNIFFAKEANEKTAQLFTKLTDIKLFGSIDSNYHLRPLDETATVQSITNLYTKSSVTRNYTLAQWASDYTYDRNSRKSPYTFAKANKSDSLYFFDYNASLSAKTISLPGKYADAKGNTYHGSIVLQPYGSAVLMKIGTLSTIPVVSLTTPVANASFDAQASIRLTASASDPDGIKQVAFYNGTTLLGTDSAAPYEFTWNNVGAGKYELSVKATDAKGQVGNSAAVAIQVVNSKPAITLLTPVAGNTYEAPGSVRIAADATDDDGIARVDFYDGTNLLGSDHTAPYEFTWNGVAAGSYNVSARAIDVKGHITQSAVAPVSIINQAPTVTLTSPVAGSSFQAPATVTVAADASDAGGIEKVAFYRDGILVNTDSIAPYAFTWTNAAGGTYSFTARAFDRDGLSTTSTAATITIAGDKPLLMLTSPVANASYTAPGSVRLTATASDADGIHRVEFYKGNTLLISERAAPYDQTWTNVAPGTYTIHARAYDKLGNLTVSNSVTITVNAATQKATAGSQPTVSLTSPVNNATYKAPASFGLIATAADNDGIAKVEFYRGATLVDVEKIAPYSWKYANLPAGTYTFTAKAYDKKGNVTTSAPVTVVVYDNLTAIAQNKVALTFWEETPKTASIFPNPTSGNITVQLGSVVNSHNAILSIVDMQGKKVLHKTVSISGTSLPVNVSSLSAGTYILTLTDDRVLGNFKFVKQ
ncbi:Ig-like domain-containing protein [Cnuella takakiae]|nr:Ig-like domain-containing protein [Cnuella takakiae]